MDVARIAKNLNLRAPRRALLLDAPQAFDPMVTYLREVLGAAVDEAAAANVAYEYVHVFTRTVEQASMTLPVAVQALAGGGVFWVSYPKRASKRYDTDLSRDGHGWAPLYERDFEPVRQVSVDDDWSALRFRPVAEIGRMTRAFAMSEAGKRRTRS